MPGIPNFRAATAEECEQIAVGDFVRSYDFDTHEDCYVEGKVQAIGEVMEGCERYEIFVLKRIFGGERIDHGGGKVAGDNLCFPPVNGTRHLFGGYCNGVRKVDEEAAEFWREKLADWTSDGYE